MKKKIICSLLIIISLFVITGCGSNTNNNSKNKESTNEIKTKLSCHHETSLFHSKKSVEHIVSLNKDNKLIGYEYIEKYYDFDDDNNFNMICDGAPEEAELNNKSYDYLKEVANCNQNSKEITISDLYDISKLVSKNPLKSKELVESLDDDYVVDIENFKTAIGKKGYICEEK